MKSGRAPAQTGPGRDTKERDSLMHDQRKAASPDAEDQRDERAVYVHLVETHPANLTLSDLLRELSGPEDT